MSQVRVTTTTRNGVNPIFSVIFAFGVVFYFAVHDSHLYLYRPLFLFLFGTNPGLSM